MDRIYITTGMGRSGSTFLAECLENNGVDMGSEMWYSQKERIDFVNLNKEVYQKCGVNGNMGDIPPSEQEIAKLKDIYQDRYKSLFGGISGELGGVKDPRLVVTYPIWKDVLLSMNDDPFIYITIRRPEKVAESLKRQIDSKDYDYDLEQGKEVAKEYARRVISMIKDIYEI